MSADDMVAQQMATVHCTGAEWAREHACYGESRSTGCGTPAEEMLQSRGNR